MNDRPEGAPARAKLRREELRRAPHLGWTASIELLTGIEDWQRLNASQRVAWLAFHYDADVTTGGHLKFFDRANAARRDATRQALDELEASPQRAVLDLASTIASGAGSPAEIGERLDAVDLAYHEIEPDVAELLARWLDDRLPEFVELVD